MLVKAPAGLGGFAGEAASARASPFDDAPRSDATPPPARPEAIVVATEAAGPAAIAAVSPDFVSSRCVTATMPMSTTTAAAAPATTGIHRRRCGREVTAAVG